jgi:hypothetical protein
MTFMNGAFFTSLPPSCWQVFGFDGPTNRHNLDQAFRERRNAPTIGDDRAFITLAYQDCCDELDNMKSLG